MSENSVLILNLGLHYMESIRLQDYRILLLKVIDLLNERNKGTGELKHKARVVWKTSTSISKEKDPGSQLTSERRRFLAVPVSMWGKSRHYSWHFQVVICFFFVFFGTLLLFFFVRMVGWSSTGWKVDISASRSLISRVILLRSQFEFTQF